MKKCIIIGASSGIGQALTELLLQDDFMIGITGRREMLLDAIKEKNPNREVVIIEQRETGAGASGRNGGFCNAGNALEGLTEGRAT